MVALSRQPEGIEPDGEEDVETAIGRQRVAV